MSNYLIAYDIVSDKLRTHVANKLLYYGLTRLQLSVFMGDLRPHLKRDLTAWLDERRKKDFGASDKLLILPLHDSLLAKAELLGEHGMDMEMVFGKRLTLIM